MVGHHASFPTIQGDFGANFVHVCRHSNELSTTNIILFESRDIKIEKKTISAE